VIKVASYCRVSTERDDQANSFESQQRYFKEYISLQPDWELCQVYADDGIILGTSQEVLAPQGFPDLVLIFIWLEITGP